MGNFIDMTGWVMKEHGVSDSRITVINRIDNYISPNGTRYAMWHCLCECGNGVDVRGDHLRDGSTLSCGCYQKEQTCQACKKYNTYELNLQDEYGMYGVGYTLNTNEPFYFDMEDYDKIKEYCWSKHCPNGTYYCVVTKINNKSIKFHQMIGCKNYDHADRNACNNRKHNLRPATNTQNALNKGLKTDNTSGFTGVSQTRNGTWNARLTMNKKVVFNKTFKTKDEAIIARLQNELVFCGEFAPQRHLFEEYGIISNGGENN